MVKARVCIANLLLLFNGFILWAVTSISITGKSSVGLATGSAAVLFYAITCVGVNYLLFRHATQKAKKDSFVFSLFMAGAVAFFIVLPQIV